MNSVNPGAVAIANQSAWPSRVPLPSAAHAENSVRADFSGPVPSLAVRDGEHWLAIHGRRDPVRDAARSLDDIDLPQTSTLFVVGLGLGYLVDVLEQRGWTGKVVAFEPSPALVGACLQRRDWRSWLESGRLFILSGPAYEGLAAVIPTLDPNREEPVIVVNPVVARVYAAAMPEILHTAARAWFGARANQEARRRNGGRYLLNTLRNARTLSTAADVRELAGQFASVPAIVVAAGPSLDDNAREIAAYRDRAIVIAVDTALRPLLHAGVHPDLVVAVDPGEANARHLVDLPPCPEACLVSEGSVDPEAVRGFDDRLFAFRVGDHQPWSWLRARGVDCGSLRAWGSVLTTAFDLALSMGCDPLVFSGADLGFTDGQPYARGTVYEEDWRREEAWGRAIEDSWAARVAEWPETRDTGVADVPVRTAPHLVAFRDWLVAESNRATGRTIVNATGRGILHGPGIAQSSFARLFGPRQPLGAGVRFRIQALLASSAGRRRQVELSTAVDDTTLAAWCEFNGVSREAVAAALTPAPAGLVGSHNVQTASAATDGNGPAQGTDPSSPVATAAAACHPNLSQADAECLSRLAASHTLQILALRDPAQPFTDEVAAAAAAMTTDTALVIVDELGLAAGAQVRRAVDAVLCEQPEVWLDYRRFVDHASTISILRRDAASAAAGSTTIDAAKWEPGHRTVASTLAPIVMSRYAPGSVVDVGCGAGYWLQAFAGLGVDRRVGYTPCLAENPVDTTVQALAIEQLLGNIDTGGTRFDVCLALEVVQELPPDAHRAFVAACIRLSDLVVFSSRLPGVPGTSPYARPLTYWARLFREHGYQFEDGLRPIVEQRYGFPRTVYDVLVAFRKCLPSPSTNRAEVTGTAAAECELQLDASVARLHDLYAQSIWWAVRANDLQAASSRAVPVNAGMRRWVIPSWRMMGEPGGLRTVPFRTDAARWYLTDARATLLVFEDERPLTRFATLAELTAVSQPGWVLVRDELTISSGDGTDPRHNHRRYTLEWPGFVSWAESQPLADVLRLSL